MNYSLVFIYLFCAIIVSFFGLIVLLTNRRGVTNLNFFLFAVSVSLWSLSLMMLYSNFNASEANIWVKAAYGSSILIGITGVTFFYYYPIKSIQLPRPLIILFLLLSGFVFSISTFTNLVHISIVVENNIYVSDVLGPLYYLYLGYIVILAGFYLYFVINKISTLKGIEKRKFLFSAISSFVFVALAICINVVLPFFNIFFYQTYTVILTLIFILPTFYSFFKYRFFNLSFLLLIASRAVILIAAYAIILNLINEILHILLPAVNGLIVTASGVLSLIILILLNKVIPILTPSSFIKLKNSLNELKSKIYFCDSFKDLNHEIENCFILKCGIKNIQLFSVREKKANFPTAIYIKDDFTKLLEKYKDELLVLDEIKYKKLPQNEERILFTKMKKTDATVIIPLFSEKLLIGFIVIGSKENNSLYTKEELNELNGIKRPLEITLMNLLIKLNLREENNLVKKIIDEKTAELRKQFIEIKELLKQQSDFLAITAHEFRTPLSIALFQLEDTLINHKHSPEVMQDIKTTEEALINLKQLTQKLFDVQQYDLNKVELHKEKTDIGEYFEKIYNEFLPLMKEKNIKFTFINKLRKPLFINFDNGHIRQVILNLLNNAVKFIDNKKPQIKLILSLNKPNAQIAVEDNGPGIPDSYKKTIFEKFRTVKAAKGMGIGLGLYLSKKILELHKSKIWVEDTKNRGSVFKFLLGK